MDREEASEFIKNTLGTLRQHVTNRNVGGARLESHMFNSAMDEYKPCLSSEERKEYKNEYSEIMMQGGRSLLEIKL